jgi:hypothetical protein
MSNAPIPPSHRDLLDDPIPVALTTIGKVLARYGTGLASFPGPRADQNTITLPPNHVVTQG